MEEKKNNKISIHRQIKRKVSQWSQFSISSLILVETKNGIY